MTDSTNTEQAEVEGHAAKGKFEPAADVEGHAKRFHRADEAEAPEPDAADESREGGEPEVEGHIGKFKF